MEASCWQRCLLSLFGCRKRQFLHSSIANPTGTSGARRLWRCWRSPTLLSCWISCSGPIKQLQTETSTLQQLTGQTHVFQTMLNSAVQLIALGHTWPLVIICTDQYCEEKAPALKATPRRFLFAPLPALFCFSLDSQFSCRKPETDQILLNDWQTCWDANELKWALDDRDAC